MEMRGKSISTKSSELLDCTLRDGSYAINFQFSAADTALLVGALDKAGVQYIEVGHGVGFHGSDKGYGEALETDEGYLKSAANSVQSAKFGMFCIPGIAELDDLKMAESYAMGFVRIGTDVTEVDTAKPFIKLARNLGMKVMSNFMKSYALSPREFAGKVLEVVAYGSEVVYVVDSAGGMMPNEVADYIQAVRDVSDISIGFHGHNNLGLAVGNSLRALEEGAVLVDGSLQGLGRSAGNAPTEVLAVLIKNFTESKIDPLLMMDIGEKYIKPLVVRRGISSLDVVSGQAQFHSSYMGIIAKMAGRYQVDPRMLILRLTELDKINADPSLVERLAQELQHETVCDFTARFEFNEYFGAEQGEK